MGFDIIFEELQSFGLAQKYVVILCNLVSVHLAFAFMSSFFTLYVPPHRCAIPGYANDTFGVQGHFHQLLINRTIPLPSDKTLPYDECHVFPAAVEYDEDNHAINGTAISCDRWVYDDSVFEETLGAKLNIVCGRKALKSNGQMIFFAGVFFGSLVSGMISDRYGRKPTFMATLVITLVSMVALAWTPHYAFYLAFRFIVGAASIASFMSSYVIAIEIVGPSHRKTAGIIGQFMWVIGTLLLSWMGHGLHTSFHLQLAGAFSGFLLLSFWWLIPESPRWLLSCGRIEESKKIIRRMAKYNKTVLSEGVLDRMLEREVDLEESGRIWQIFTSRTLCCRTIIMFVNWIVVCMVYYGLALNSGNLGGNMFLNFALNGLMDLPGNIITLFLIDLTGRKRLHIAFMVIGGVACLSTIFTTQFGSKDLQKLTMALALIGKVGASGAFTTTYIYTSELYPTVVRNATLGLCSCMARIGGMVAPYIADIENLVGDKGFGKALPMILFGSMSVAAGLLTLMLPETHKEHLPEDIRDAKYLGRKKKDKKGKLQNPTVGVHEMDTKMSTMA